MPLRGWSIIASKTQHKEYKQCEKLCAGRVLCCCEIRGVEYEERPSVPSDGRNCRLHVDLETTATHTYTWHIKHWWSLGCIPLLSDTDNTVPFENTTPISLINLLCILLTFLFSLMEWYFQTLHLFYKSKREPWGQTIERIPSQIVEFHPHDLGLTLKTFSAMPIHMMNMCGKFHWSKEIIVSCEINVNRQQRDNQKTQCLCCLLLVNA